MAGLAQLLRRIDGPAELPVALDPESIPVSISTAIAGIRRPGAVQAAQQAVEAAREAAYAAHGARVALTAQRGSRDTGDSEALAAAGAEEERTKQALRDRKTELRVAIAGWEPALRRQLAPHRAAAAARIASAVQEIEAALIVMRQTDGFMEKWAIAPHPRLNLSDLQSLRRTAERIAVVEGDR